MPPPSFTLTEQQRQAILAMEWLYGTENLLRGAGRTTAIAIVALRNALREQNGLRHRWVSLGTDHFSSQMNTRLLSQMVKDVADILGIEVEIRNRPRNISSTIAEGEVRILHLSAEAQRWLTDLPGPGSPPVDPVADSASEDEPPTVWDRLTEPPDF
jgi:hypothetical protein